MRFSLRTRLQRPVSIGMLWELKRKRDKLTDQMNLRNFLNVDFFEFLILTNLKQIQNSISVFFESNDIFPP